MRIRKNLTAICFTRGESKCHLVYEIQWLTSSHWIQESNINRWEIKMEVERRAGWGKDAVHNKGEEPRVYARERRVLRLCVCACVCFFAIAMALGSRFCAAISPNFDSSGTSVVSFYLLMTLNSPLVHRIIAWAFFCLDPIVGVVVVADLALLILSWLHRVEFADTAFFSFCDAPVFNCLDRGSLRS